MVEHDNLGGVPRADRHDRGCRGYAQRAETRSDGDKTCGFASKIERPFDGLRTRGIAQHGCERATCKARAELNSLSLWERAGVRGAYEDEHSRLYAPLTRAARGLSQRKRRILISLS